MLQAACIVLAWAASGCGARRGQTGVAVSTADDGRIRREVEVRLAAEPSIGPGLIRVEVRGGRVLLHGGVRGIGAWQCALRNASLVDGVVSVVDYLVLEGGPRDITCLAPRELRSAS